VPDRLYFFGSADARPQIVCCGAAGHPDVGEFFSCRFTADTQNGYILAASGLERPLPEPHCRR
jgi:hypothetical protein